MNRIAWGLMSALLTLAPSLATAQTPALDIRSLGVGAAVLIGQDGNVVIVAGPEGAVLIDAERPHDVPEMQAAARTLTEGPIRYVINTHWHSDHSGGNAAFAEQGATLIAHRNVRTRMGADQYMAAYRVTIPASPPKAWPDVVFDRDLTLHFGDETIRMVHTPNAHTDGDILVKLEKANVLHMGDVYFGGMFPFIDRSTGGGIEGLIASVDMGLSLADEQTKIVPAHGEVATRADLQTYRDMLRAVADDVKARHARGEPMMTVIEAGLTAPYKLEGEANGFVAAIYSSYARP